MLQRLHPWGTYLICEENWHNYFVNHDPQDLAARVSHQRYGIAGSGLSKLYGWETADPRFDATPQADQPHGGYVNEPHRFGWVVEVDPFAPDSVPVKRTAFGRYCRECSVLSLGEDGRMAFYSGDDTKGEYVYKFVPNGRFVAGADADNRRLLDEGTLYVARFDADGSGEWLALVHGEHGLTAENGFPGQAEVLLNARAAADRAGATPMDRPEWVAVHPHSREVYVTLTNNDGRGAKQPLDRANPRPNNLHGQILRWQEDGGDPTATRFEWEVFLLAGERSGRGTPRATRWRPIWSVPSTATASLRRMVWRSMLLAGCGSRPISTMTSQPCRPWAPTSCSVPTRSPGRFGAFWWARVVARLPASPGARTTAPCG